MNILMMSDYLYLYSCDENNHEIIFDFYCLIYKLTTKACISKIHKINKEYLYYKLYERRYTTPFDQNSSSRNAFTKDLKLMLWHDLNFLTLKFHLVLLRMYVRTSKL